MGPSPSTRPKSANQIKFIGVFFAFYTWSGIGEAFLETALTKSFISKINTLGNGYRICVATGGGAKRGSCPPTGSGLDPEIRAKSDEKYEHIVGVAG